MSISLIELRDNAITVSRDGEVLARSPGFANIAGDTPVFGDAARQQARLHPRHTLNQFWAQLGLDPLPLKSKQFRHSADLAFSHLDSITRSLELDEVVIAAPGSYNRNQLAVLLGIVRQCAFTTVGLADLALLQAVGSESPEHVIIDFQLHQAVLSSFRRVDGHLLRERVVQVPAAGIVALQDAWLNMIADEFVRQSRFDPQRDAETEQYLANRLASWISASQAHPEVLVEINLKGSVQQARLTLAHFEQRAQPIFNRIAKELDDLRNPGTVLHVAASHMNLPGLTQALPGLIALDDELAQASVRQHLDNIRRPPDNLQFVTRLPLGGASPGTAAPVTQAKTPTHVLINHRAVLLPPGRLAIGMPPAGLDSARIMPLAQNGFSGAIALLRSGKGVQLELHTGEAVLHNGRPAQAGQALALGDTLQLGAQGPSLQLIVVEGA